MVDALANARLTEHDRNGYERVIEGLKNRNDLLIDNIRKLEDEYEKSIKEEAAARASKSIVVTTKRLRMIDNYDRYVRAVIESNENLKEQWEMFQVLYQMTVNDELLTRARDKILREERKKNFSYEKWDVVYNDPALEHKNENND